MILQRPARGLPLRLRPALSGRTEADLAFRMNNTYVIEFEVPDGATIPRFGHTTIVAPVAHDAVEEFYRNHPDADIRELRRVHVHEQ